MIADFSLTGQTEPQRPSTIEGSVTQLLKSFYQLL
jgi:hypothetical protein